MVTCTTEQLARVFNGYLTWNDAVRAELIQVSGRREVVRALPTWFLWSPWAADIRERELVSR